MNELWVEKYRPKKFDDIVGQNQIVEEIKGAVATGSLPHLLLYGPAGVGKTTMAYVIGRELFGDNFRSNFLELNASDERGIDVIRNKVKGFAKVKSLSADFKVIFLDEADYLTADAQASLRRIMEVYHKTTRFILSCNYVQKIISPNQSVCKCYQFNKISRPETMKILSKIATEEEVEFNSRDGFDYTGDLREIINNIQGGIVKIKRKNYVKEILGKVMKKDFLGARVLVDSMFKEGWDERRILIEIRSLLFKANNAKTFISTSRIVTMRATSVTATISIFD